MRICCLYPEKRLLTVLILASLLAVVPTLPANTSQHAQPAFNDTSTCIVIVYEKSTLPGFENGPAPGFADADNDGIGDLIEGMTDYDGDGIANYLDTDSDGDGLLDARELGYITDDIDQDGDGQLRRLDHNDHDRHNSCLARSFEPADRDNDGQPDFLDPVGPAHTAATDPCAAEGGYYDTDTDLIPDIIEGNVDTDGDLLPDYIDLDSDNDGLDDRTESGFVLRRADSDQDGYVFEIELEPIDRNHVCASRLIPPVDRNQSGVADYREPASFAPETHLCAALDSDVDTDGDLIPDRMETDQDQDNDGIANYLDLDSDNDGISDKLENFGFTLDFELYEFEYSKGRFLHGTDSDFDGLPQFIDINNNNRDIRCITNPRAPVDTNDDGVPDFLDSDIDDDGLVDGLETYYYGVRTIDSDGDGLSDFDEYMTGSSPRRFDTDEAGAGDHWEIRHGADPTNPDDDAALPVDQDIDDDGIPNEQEIALHPSWKDTDSDGLSDAREAGFPDSDNNGIIDDRTDVNFNGIPDIAETDAALPDFDKDGVPDFRDRDSDQDGIPDHHEHTDLSPAGLDVDSDGLINSHDLDSDNDGVFDFEEAGPHLSEYLAQIADHQYPVIDRNGDGKIDEMDDRNNDGIPDSVSVLYHPDKPDTDGDGIIDEADIDHATRLEFNASTYTWELATPIDTDNDGIEDAQDPDPYGHGIFLHSVKSMRPVDADRDGAYSWLDFDDHNAAIIQPPPGIQTKNTTNGVPHSGGGGGASGLILFMFAISMCRRRTSVV